MHSVLVRHTHFSGSLGQQGQTSLGTRGHLGSPQRRCCLLPQPVKESCSSSSLCRNAEPRLPCVVLQMEGDCLRLIRHNTWLSMHQQWLITSQACVGNQEVKLMGLMTWKWVSTCWDLWFEVPLCGWWNNPERRPLVTISFYLWIYRKCNMHARAFFK